MLKKACHDVSAEPETVDFGLSVESHKYKLGIENSSLTSSPLDVIYALHQIWSTFVAQQI